MVEDFCETGEFSPKLMTFMTVQDVVNIVILSLLRCDVSSSGLSEVVSQERMKNIAEVFRKLDFENRINILRNLGLEFILSNNLDEIEPYMSTSIENKSKYRPPPPKTARQEATDLLREQLLQKRVLPRL